MSRLRSDIWVAAYLRRCASDGVPAVLRRRGAAEAGAIFVIIDRLDGTAALFSPAPQSGTVALGIERVWLRAHDEPWIEASAVAARLAKQISFDPDLWLIEVEDRLGASRLDLAED